jgi:hypothetical protein
MKNSMIKIITVSFLSSFTLSAFAENATEIHFGELSQLVQSTVLTQVKQTEITKVEKIFDEEITKYEIESLVNGKNKDITLSADGKLIEIEQGVDFNHLSTSVKKAIEHDYPNMKFDEIEAVQSFFIAIEGTVKGKKVAFHVLPSGDIEDESDADEKD